MPALQVSAPDITTETVRTILLVVVLTVSVIMAVWLRHMQIHTLELRAEVFKIRAILSLSVQPDPNGPRRRQVDRLLGGESPHKEIGPAPD